MNNNQIPNEMRSDIISMFEIDKLPEDKQEETIQLIGKIIFDAVLMRVLPLMDDESLSEYEKILASEPGEETSVEIINFFSERVPNFMDIIIEEAENFRKTSSYVLLA